jgi:hypothetical protein
MDFPKAYIQEREDYRTNEAERKLYMFLRDYFAAAYSKLVSGTRYYLFGKSTIHATDKAQFANSLQVSAHGSSAAIALLRTQGTETAYSGTVAGVIGSINGVGYNSSTFAVGASIQFVSSDTWTGAANGTYIQFRTTPTGSATTQDSGHIAPSGSWASGTGTLATNATKGFLYIPTCAGVPTGVPESISGRIPLVADTSGGKVYAYLGGWTALN